MSEKIYVQIGDKRIEAKGEVLEQILKDQTEAAERKRLIEAEQTKKDADRASAMAKLSALGLNEQEVAALIN
jgi:hypothetical protein